MSVGLCTVRDDHRIERERLIFFAAPMFFYAKNYLLSSAANPVFSRRRLSKKIT